MVHFTGFLNWHRSGSADASNFIDKDEPQLNLEYFTLFFARPPNDQSLSTMSMENSVKVAANKTSHICGFHTLAYFDKIAVELKDASDS